MKGRDRVRRTIGLAVAIIHLLAVLVPVPALSLTQDCAATLSAGLASAPCPAPDCPWQSGQDKPLTCDTACAACSGSVFHDAPDRLVPPGKLNGFLTAAVPTALTPGFRTPLLRPPRHTAI